MSSQPMRLASIPRRMAPGFEQWGRVIRRKTVKQCISIIHQTYFDLMLLQSSGQRTVSLINRNGINKVFSEYKNEKIGTKISYTLKIFILCLLYCLNGKYKKDKII
jgi:hypothetical protein